MAVITLNAGDKASINLGKIFELTRKILFVSLAQIRKLYARY